MNISISIAMIISDNKMFENITFAFKNMENETCNDTKSNLLKATFCFQYRMSMPKYNTEKDHFILHAIYEFNSFFKIVEAVYHNKE